MQTEQKNQVTNVFLSRQEALDLVAKLSEGVAFSLRLNNGTVNAAVLPSIHKTQKQDYPTVTNFFVTQE